MGIATIALIVYVLLIIAWVVIVKRNIGEAMIVGFIVTALFGGKEVFTLIKDGFIFGATHEVLFAAMSFVFMAFLIEQTGLIEKLINILNSVFGKLPGGAAYVDTIASAIFGTISGSGSGNTATVGAITIPWMNKSGWTKEQSATIAAGNAGMGISFPPNGSMFILLGAASISAVVTEGQLYVALFIAGFYTLIYRLIVIFWFVKRSKIKKVERAGQDSFIGSLKKGWTSLIIFLGILIPVMVTIGPVSEFIEGTIISKEALKSISIIVWVPMIITLITIIVGWKSIPKQPKAFMSFLEKSIPSFGLIGVILLFSFSASDVLKRIGLADELGTMMGSLDLSPGLMALIVGLLIVIVATPLTATATVTAIGTVAFTALVSSGIDPVVAAVVVLVFASTEGASPPGGAPIFIASGISGADPVKTFVPLIVYYVIPIAFIAWLLAVGWLPLFT
ncbi:TRAP transporter large permease subunit [Sporosarcina oncorhynchi]|uniref:TRAP transporter large permease subunit n=1 Tax=Sporosarcina oncorhynchi TaxID=3056444 RepID=A0ABZ0L4G8_9BACL|nr:TRAP transporter large permease subunit [Sporosarcina sp. T2O-4]WOV87383.1 TRAP transporter large permease subunit [Sporosarcina sp. T2O-4]